MIELHSLRKVYGDKVAVENLSLTVEKGQVLGLLGPNGAGKSTTMKMLSGCLRPTSGRALLCGKDVWENPVHAKKTLGFLPESAPSYEEQTVAEFLKYFAQLSGLKGKSAKNAASRVIDLCFLEEVRNQSIETLSKGYRHRVCLAQSIIHDPPIIVFDEPTDGLDPNQKHEIRRLIEMVHTEKAIILSTHILEEVDAVCTDVVLMDQGKVVAKGTPAELRLRSDTAKKIRIRTTKKVERLIEEIEKIEHIEFANAIGEKLVEITATNSSIETMNTILERIRELTLKHQWPILETVQETGNLSEVFRDLTFTKKN